MAIKYPLVLGQNGILEELQTGDTIPGGGTGPGNGIPSSNIIYVDYDFSGVSDGSVSAPYTNIQAGVDHYGLPQSEFDMWDKKVVKVVTGLYVEDVEVPPARNITIVFQSGAELKGNITLLVDKALETSLIGVAPLIPLDSFYDTSKLRPILQIQATYAIETSNTHISELGFTLNGDLLRKSVGIGAGVHDIVLQRVKILGSYKADTGTVGSLGINNLYLYSSHIVGTIGELPSLDVGGNNINIQVADRVQFDSEIICNGLGGFNLCILKGNVNAQALVNDVPPNGFINCKFSTIQFTGPANLVVDGWGFREAINNVTFTGLGILVDVELRQASEVFNDSSVVGASVKDALELLSGAIPSVSNIKQEVIEITNLVISDKRIILQDTPLDAKGVVLHVVSGSIQVNKKSKGVGSNAVIGNFEMDVNNPTWLYIDNALANEHGTNEEHTGLSGLTAIPGSPNYVVITYLYDI